MIAIGPAWKSPQILGAARAASLLAPSQDDEDAQASAVFLTGFSLAASDVAAAGLDGREGR